MRKLKGVGYDATVTFEIFAPEPAYTEASVRLWQEWWEGGAEAPPS